MIEVGNAMTIWLFCLLLSSFQANFLAQLMHCTFWHRYFIACQPASSITPPPSPPSSCPCLKQCSHHTGSTLTSPSTSQQQWGNSHREQRYFHRYVSCIIMVHNVYEFLLFYCYSVLFEFCIVLIIRVPDFLPQSGDRCQFLSMIAIIITFVLVVKLLLCYY